MKVSLIFLASSPKPIDDNRKNFVEENKQLNCLLLPLRAIPFPLELRNIEIRCISGKEIVEYVV